MPSAAQIDANRANARRSTGPRTPGGKTVSRSNALKHGLYAERILAPAENQPAFQQLQADFADEFRPKGRYETALVKRLGAIWWRLEQMVGMEAAFMPTQDRRVPSARQVRGLNRLGCMEARLLRVADQFERILLRRQTFRRRMRSGNGGLETLRVGETTRRDAPPGDDLDLRRSTGATVPNHWLRSVKKIAKGAISTPYVHRFARILACLMALIRPPPRPVHRAERNDLFRTSKSTPFLALCFLQWGA